MDTTTLKLKNEELAKKINEIDQYCKKNNIPYFLLFLRPMNPKGPLTSILI